MMSMFWSRTFLSLGAVTPIGGLGFILGWIALVIAGWRARLNAV